MCHTVASYSMDPKQEYGEWTSMPSKFNRKITMWKTLIKKVEQGALFVSSPGFLCGLWYRRFINTLPVKLWPVFISKVSSWHIYCQGLTVLWIAGCCRITAFLAPIPVITTTLIIQWCWTRNWWGCGLRLACCSRLLRGTWWPDCDCLSNSNNTSSRTLACGSGFLGSRN